MEELSIFNLLESEINKLSNLEDIISLRKKEALEVVFDVLKTYEDKKYNVPIETYDFMMMNFLLSYLPKKMSDKLSNSLTVDENKIEDKNLKELVRVKRELVRLLCKYDFNNETTDYNKIITWLDENFVRRYSVLNNETCYYSKDEIYLNPDFDYFEKRKYERNMELDREDEDAKKCNDLIRYADLDYKLATKLETYGSLRNAISLYYQLINSLRTISINDEYTKTIKTMDKIIDILLKKYDKYIILARKTIMDLDLDKLYEERKEEIQENKNLEESFEKTLLHQ